MLYAGTEFDLCGIIVPGWETHLVGMIYIKQVIGWIFIGFLRKTNV